MNPGLEEKNNIHFEGFHLPICDVNTIEKKEHIDNIHINPLAIFPYHIERDQWVIYSYCLCHSMCIAMKGILTKKSGNIGCNLHGSTTYFMYVHNPMTDRSAISLSPHLLSP